MSVGILCQCPKPEHGQRSDRLGGGPGCSRYAMNQAIGGQCSSCAFGFHEPCGELVLPRGALAGECLRCRWHSSEHAR